MVEKPVTGSPILFVFIILTANTVLLLGRTVCTTRVFVRIFLPASATNLDELLHVVHKTTRPILKVALETRMLRLERVLVATVQRCDSRRLHLSERRVQVDGDLVEVLGVQAVAEAAHGELEAFEGVFLKSKIARHFGHVLVEPGRVRRRLTVRVGRHDHNEYVRVLDLRLRCFYSSLV